MNSCWLLSTLPIICNIYINIHIFILYYLKLNLLIWVRLNILVYLQYIIAWIILLNLRSIWVIDIIIKFQIICWNWSLKISCIDSHIIVWRVSTNTAHLLISKWTESKNQTIILRLALRLRRTAGKLRLWWSCTITIIIWSFATYSVARIWRSCSFNHWCNLPGWTHFTIRLVALVTI